MLLDRPKEEIARDLLARASDTWGPGRAEALHELIAETADWISLIARHQLPVDGDEPDFLVAPAVGKEAERWS